MYLTGGVSDLGNQMIRENLLMSMDRRNMKGTCYEEHVRILQSVSPGIGVNGKNLSNNVKLRKDTRSFNRCQ